MASVERESRTSWRVRWREGGKRRTSERYRSEGQALAAAEAIEARLSAAKPIRNRPVVGMLELVERWIIVRQAAGKYTGRYAEKARDALTSAITSHAWASPSDVRPDQMKAMKVGRLRLLRSLLSYAADLDQPVDPRCLRIRPAPRPRAPRGALLTREQVAAAVEEATAWNPSCGALVRLLATYGHRPETAVRIRVGEVDLPGRRLRVTVKGGDTIDHPLDQGICDVLAPLVAGRGPEEVLFQSHLGAPWAAGQAFAEWYWHQVGRRAHPHDQGCYALKRFAISNLLDKGIDPVTVASVTGHRTPSLLIDRYGRTNANRQARVVDAISEMDPEWTRPSDATP
ncbi:DNA_BRE_C domain containing protein [uncultured Caudovirales phage]|uniref:DNA_BRE_C domain containing protein n=1 Tax=uncultured Caudovirales phage TaxID=2100421 RepID=A0A6J7VM89_9CAUD|nr:DNA_BRE_C domain containing protein [uncultured Caudovirales phage]